MKIYSYVVRYDDGVAPNPFWGYCTLAICKPDIRRVAEKGDWVIGTGSVENVGNNKLIYAMKVTDKMPLEDYASNKRFSRKIPVGKKGIKSLGDNIYYEDENGTVRQRVPSAHSDDDRENSKHRKRDLSGIYVLISKAGNFYYFGKKAIKIPDKFLCLVKKGPKHKCDFPESKISAFVRWIQKKKPGIYGHPYGYSKNIKGCNKENARSKTQT